MIRYIPAKEINLKIVQKYLEESKKAHLFTNNGPVKQRLELSLEDLFSLDSEIRRVACTSSGTSALFVLISLFEKHAGKPLKWATSAFNFPAAVVNKLSTDVIDLNEDLKTFDVKNFDKYDGIILPTLFGTLPNIEEIEKYCISTNKFLILDNASSPLTTLNGRNINTYGDGCIFSLHHTKYLGVGEGGGAVINPEFYDDFISLTNFGFSDDRQFNALASNAKMSDIAAAHILSYKYNILEHIVTQNYFLENIAPISNVECYNYSEGVVYGNLPLVFKKPISHLSFRDIGIEANKYYKPLKELPNSKELYSRMINLPLNSYLTDFEIDLILKKIIIESER